MARFLNEARAVNLIAHPSVVSIYELGQLPGGDAFIIMEYLDGDRLSDRLRRAGGDSILWTAGETRRLGR